MADADAPIVSVILCNFNYARFLGQALQSVLDQSFSDLELIVVDDGSTDDSLQVIGSFDDPRLRSVARVNGGQAAAFNSGFEVARGEFIAFLDSDDFWMPGKLERVVHALRHENVGVIQHPMLIVDAHGRNTDKLHPKLISGCRDILQMYFDANHTGFFSATSGIVCVRAVLEEVFPLDESWRICADVAFTRPLPLFSHVLTLEEPLGYYRVHGSNHWMNTEAQGRWIENEQRKNDYTNLWLARAGYRERLDFSQSRRFRDLKRGLLPRWHPNRIATKLMRHAREFLRLQG